MHPLSNVYLWEGFRFLLDQTFGHYRKRIGMLHQMGFTGKESMLDVGCGTGHYAEMTQGSYLGLDLDPKYIEFARRRHPNKEFSCMNVAELKLDGKKYDITLIVDVIHHLSANDAKNLFRELTRVTSQRIYFFEIIIPKPTNYIGRWMVANDRGHFVRSRQDLTALIGESFKLHDVRDLRLGPWESTCIAAQPLEKSGR